MTASQVAAGVLVAFVGVWLIIAGFVYIHRAEKADVAATAERVAAEKAYRETKARVDKWGNR